MTQDDKEREFLKHTKTLLQDSAARLDEATVAELRAARSRAVARSVPRVNRGWLWVGTTAAASAAIVMILSIWLPGTPPSSVPISGLDNVEDVDLLSGAEEIQFYQDLEFYRWLDNEQDAG